MAKRSGSRTNQRRKRPPGDAHGIIFESSPLPIMSFSLDREVLAINPMAERLLGWQAAEVVGKVLPVPPSAESDWKKMRRTLAAGRQVRNLVTRRYNSAGKEIAVLISAAPVVSKSGKVQSYTTVISDTAPMLKMEQALEQSEERRALTLKAAGIGSWWYDAHTRTLEWDDRCKELFGVPAHTPGLGFEEFLALVHVEDREATRREILRALDKRSAYDMRHRVVWRDGSVHWLRCKGDFNHAGDPHLIGISVDITWVKKNEELARRVERLNASAELGSALAHEVNNPMEILCNALYLMRNDLGKDHYALGIANDAYNRIAEITRQMLVMHTRTSKAEAIDVAEIAESALEQVRDVVEARSIKIHKGLEPAKLTASPVDIKHLLANLLENAVEHAPKDGTVAVRLYPSRELRYGTRKGVRLVVADNGKGISEEMQKQLFQPFISTKERRGAGLGLWVAQAIARKYGGSVRVRSSVEHGRRGTCVSVFLRSLPHHEVRAQRAGAAD